MSLWFKRRDTWVCAPPKCGGTALYCAALGIDPKVGRHVFSTAQGLTEFHDEPGRPALMAVRDPVDRFASLWRDKCRDGDENMPWLAGMTPDELMTHIEADPAGNPHWMPQRYWWREWVETVPFRLIAERLELPVVRVNATAPDDTPMPVARIKAHYEQDIEL